MSLSLTCSGPTSFHDSKVPHLEFDISISPLRIHPKYTFQDLERHLEHDMTRAPSDASSLSSCSSSTYSSPSLEGSSEDLTVTLQQSLEDSGDEEVEIDSFPISRKDRSRPLPQLPLPLPLPPIPSVSPSPLTSPATSPRTRPLPPTPHLLKTNGVSISVSVTPATPLLPPTPHTQSPNHLSPPKIRRLPQPLSLKPGTTPAPAPVPVPTPTSTVTNPAPELYDDTAVVVLVSPPSYQNSSGDTLIPSPNSTILEFPTTPMPTPSLARRRRLSKLKRFLGETVPDELVPIISSARDPQAAKDLLDHLTRFRGAEGTVTPEQRHEPPLDPAAISRRLMELEQDEFLSDDDSEEGGFDDIVFATDQESVLDTGMSDSCVSGGHNSFRAMPLKKYSKKWVWDKGGRRREEEDYEDILRALRSL
ncbi:hypothetical protein BT96DRAFT_934793 [Gymnopus androsaceus JB14]|uniref:Uncharacterized protein n=1 Tax=Gymnopus androsaceus JB14 TaxID=1447944 RepID=A0A6A4I9S0_9AGAR|nr:hypothetical protein BT96DRAFT_934793 [Gymnopus androsaceus JB14]